MLTLLVLPQTLMKLKMLQKLPRPSEGIISYLTGMDYETYLPVTIDINLMAGFDVASIGSSYHKVNID